MSLEIIPLKFSSRGRLRYSEEAKHGIQTGEQGIHVNKHGGGGWGGGFLSKL